jgi:hypothetical protein
MLWEFEIKLLVDDNSTHVIYCSDFVIISLFFVMPCFRGGNVLSFFKI